MISNQIELNILRDDPLYESRQQHILSANEICNNLNNALINRIIFAANAEKTDPEFMHWLNILNYCSFIVKDAKL